MTEVITGRSTTPRFLVAGVGRISGRPRNYIVQATSSRRAAKLAEQDGTYPSAIIKVALDPPDENLLALAKQYAIDVGPAMSRHELFDLINTRATYDTVPSRDLKFIAIEYGVSVTRYAGERMLFHRIFVALTALGRETDLAGWFTFAVYNDLANVDANSPVKNADDPLIRAIACQLATSPTFIDSIKRYRGVDLMWFGRKIDRNGTKQKGGSRLTFAYRRARALLLPFVVG